MSFTIAENYEFANVPRHPSLPENWEQSHDTLLAGVALGGLSAVYESLRMDHGSQTEPAAEYVLTDRGEASQKLLHGIAEIPNSRPDKVMLCRAGLHILGATYNAGDLLLARPPKVYEEIRGKGDIVAQHMTTVPIPTLRAGLDLGKILDKPPITHIQVCVETEDPPSTQVGLSLTSRWRNPDNRSGSETVRLLTRHDVVTDTISVEMQRGVRTGDIIRPAKNTSITALTPYTKVLRYLLDQ